MTICLSIASPEIILMTSDSTVVLDFDDGQREYTTEGKFHCIPGVGCVTTWGARQGNTVQLFLEKQNVSPTSHSVDDLANLVHQFLTKEYKPDKRGLDDVGYHVGSFDAHRRPRLYHIF